MFSQEMLYSGCYRVRWDDGKRLHVFGQIKKCGQQWHADIRKTETGELQRYAGVWPTLKAAREEVEAILSREG